MKSAVRTPRPTYGKEANRSRAPGRDDACNDHTLVCVNNSDTDQCKPRARFTMVNAVKPGLNGSVGWVHESRVGTRGGKLKLTLEHKSGSIVGLLAHLS